MTNEKDERIRELEEENINLKTKLKKIEKEFEEFKANHTVTVSNLRRALNIKENVESRKPLGAPKGHAGYTRHVPDRIDVVKLLTIDKCPTCSSPLSDTQEIRERVVTDIALKSKIVNTKYEIQRKYCAKCDKIVEPEVPNISC